MASPIWHGDKKESEMLMAALEHNCTCEIEESSGKVTKPCAGHAMLVTDQRQLDGLLFERHIADQLRREEFSRGARDRRQ